MHSQQARSACRALCKLVVLLLLIAGFVRSASAQSQSLIDAAKKEGEVVWYSAHLPPETFQLVSEAFAAKYPGMKLTVVSGTSGTVYQRLMQDVKMKAARADVVSTATTASPP